MHDVLRGIFGTLGAAGGLLLLQTSVFAQDATVEPIDQWPIPEPGECVVVERRTSVEILGLVETPPPTSPDQQRLRNEAFEADLEAAAVAFAAPPGHPADPGTVARVEAFVRTLYACYNAGDGSALFALVSDDALRRLPPEGLRILDSAFSATPEPRDQNYTIGYDEIRNVARLEDGRIGAVVETIPPTRSAIDVYFFLIEEDGRFLVDGVVIGSTDRPLTP